MNVGFWGWGAGCRDGEPSEAPGSRGARQSRGERREEEAKRDAVSLVVLFSVLYFLSILFVLPILYAPQRREHMYPWFLVSGFSVLDSGFRAAGRWPSGQVALGAGGPRGRSSGGRSSGQAGPPSRCVGPVRHRQPCSASCIPALLLHSARCSRPLGIGAVRQPPAAEFCAPNPCGRGRGGGWGRVATCFVLCSVPGPGRAGCGLEPAWPPGRRPPVSLYTWHRRRSARRAGPPHVCLERVAARSRPKAARSISRDARRVAAQRERPNRCNVGNVCAAMCQPPGCMRAKVGMGVEMRVRVTQG